MRSHQWASAPGELCFPLMCLLLRLTVLFLHRVEVSMAVEGMLHVLSATLIVSREPPHPGRKSSPKIGEQKSAKIRLKFDKQLIESQLNSSKWALFMRTRKVCFRIWGSPASGSHRSTSSIKRHHRHKKKMFATLARSLS